MAIFIIFLRQQLQPQHHHHYQQQQESYHQLDPRFTDMRAKEWCMNSHPKLANTLLNQPFLNYSNKSIMQPQKLTKFTLRDIYPIGLKQIVPAANLVLMDESAQKAMLMNIPHVDSMPNDPN